MKGEYQGVDGRTYQWVKTGHTGLSEGDGCYALVGGNYGKIHPADWSAAKAALDELLEEEWVDVRLGLSVWRFTRDGICKFSSYDGGDWEANQWDAGDAVAAAFLRIGREESEKLREAVLGGEPLARVLALAEEMQP